MNPKIKICSDIQHPEINKRSFAVHNWHDFYRDSKETVPADAPIPKGNVVSTHCFVDADHAGDRYTRRSQTGVLIFMNKAPKIWYSKQHKTIETRNLSSEFIALNTATELV